MNPIRILVVEDAPRLSIPDPVEPCRTRRPMSGRLLSGRRSRIVCRPRGCPPPQRLVIIPRDMLRARHGQGQAFSLRFSRPGIGNRHRSLGRGLHPQLRIRLRRERLHRAQGQTHRCRKQRADYACTYHSSPRLFPSFRVLPCKTGAALCGNDANSHLYSTEKAAFSIKSIAFPVSLLFPKTVGCAIAERTAAYCAVAFQVSL